MNRDTIKSFSHNASSLLSLDNNNYKQWVFRYTFLELEKDLGTKGDITSNLLIKKNQQKTARITANESGVVAGLEELKYFLVDSDPNFKPNLKSPFKLKLFKKDGDIIKKNDTIFEIKSGIKDILASERVILNLLMRMSGVATYTRKIVESINKYKVMITPTRKTLWGLLDKKAVFLGGGGTHRLNLTDAILIKDNHLEIYERNIEKILNKIQLDNLQCRFVEIEVENLKDALSAAKKFNSMIEKGNLRCICVILLDNMKSAEIGEIITKLKTEKLYDQVLIEASGGINEQNIEEYAKTGVDIISMGALTMNANSLDFSLHFK